MSKSDLRWYNELDCTVMHKDRDGHRSGNETVFHKQQKSISSLVNCKYTYQSPIINTLIK